MERKLPRTDQSRDRPLVDEQRHSAVAKGTTAQAPARAAGQLCIRRLPRMNLKLGPYRRTLHSGGVKGSLEDEAAVELLPGGRDAAAGRS